MFRWHIPTLLAILVFLGWLTFGNSAGHARQVDGKALQAAEGQKNARAQDDPHGEHGNALALFQSADATHQAQQSGDWSDPKTWNNGVPGQDARVLIPEGVTVTLSRQLEPVIDWLRLEGTLRFATDASTKLPVTTILIPATGSLLIGSENQRVEADQTAQVLFTPRSRAHRQHDPYDLTGGIIALGKVQIFGSDYRGFAIPEGRLEKGATRLTFAEAPRGWKVGDQLLFPASTASSQDEQRTLAELSADGKSVTLSAPLEADHGTPAGITCGVPVGNLTRNVVLASADPDTLANRAHLMFMTHEGIHLSGALFRGLGRTLTTRIHTLPEKDQKGKVDTGDNMIGRYAVHYHLRGGASLERDPQRFTGNVIVDSPKHGLVNHGGYVVADNNVTYAVHGSHFFTENGSEIGAFRNNLAVWSRGSGDKIRSRECRFDFGHGGHGFWAQSPAVTMEGNYAFHHADAAYSIFPRPVLEFRKQVLFARKNLSPEVAETAKAEQVSPGMVPFRFEGNAGGNSGKGLEVWNVNTHATHNVSSLIAGCQLWETPGGGIDLPYTFNTQIVGTTVIGRPGARYPTAGVGINTATRFLTLDQVTVSGFQVGVETPVRGHTTIASCRFDNAINLRIKSPVQPGRRTLLTGNSFTKSSPDDIDYYLAPPDCQFNGDLALLFDRDPLLIEDARFPGQTVYFAEQHPDAVPFPKSETEKLQGKTARQLWSELGLAIAGSLAPQTAASQPGVRGLIGPVSEEIRQGIQETAGSTFAEEAKARAAGEGEYTLDQNLDRVRFVKGKPGEVSGWRLETTQVDGRPRTKLFYVDSTPPHFELSPCMKLKIHPDDVKYGLEICGVLHDEVAGKETIKNMIKEYRDLQVDPDGFVTVHFSCADSVGNVAEHTYRFEVTDQAVKRGSNISYYNQKQFMPPETTQSPAVPAPAGHKHSWRGRWLAWAGGGACGLALVVGMLRLRNGRRSKTTATA